MYVCMKNMSSSTYPHQVFLAKVSSQNVLQMHLQQNVEPKYSRTCLEVNTIFLSLHTISLKSQDLFVQMLSYSKRKIQWPGRVRKQMTSVSL